MDVEVSATTPTWDCFKMVAYARRDLPSVIVTC